MCFILEGRSQRNIISKGVIYREISWWFIIRRRYCTRTVCVVESLSERLVGVTDIFFSLLLLVVDDV